MSHPGVRWWAATEVIPVTHSNSVTAGRGTSPLPTGPLPGVSSSNKGVSPIGLGPHPHGLIYLSPTFEGPVLKSSHMGIGVCFQPMNLQRSQFHPLQ